MLFRLITISIVAFLITSLSVPLAFAQTPSPSTTPSVTVQPTSSASPRPSPTPTVTVSPTATPTASPTSTPTVQPTATAIPTATPTVRPTPTPTPSPVPLILDGDVYHTTSSAERTTGGARIHLDNTSIYRVPSDYNLDQPDTSQREVVTTTDFNGHFHVDPFWPSEDKPILLFEHEGYISQLKSPTGSLQIDLKMKKCPSTIYGSTKNQRGNPIIGAHVIAARDGQIIARDVSDGNYVLEVGQPGMYSLYIFYQDPGSATPALDAPFATAEIKDSCGDFVAKDVSINRVSGIAPVAHAARATPTPRPAPKLGQPAITATVYKDFGAVNDDKLFDPAPLTGVKIKLMKAGWQGRWSVVASGNAAISFPDLSPGTYYVTADKEGYLPYTSQDIVITPTTQLAQVRIGMLKQGADTECIRKPQATIKEFWFCGREAREEARGSLYQPVWPAIDSELGRLRGKYGYSDLPYQVIVGSSYISNASFSPQARKDGKCPPSPNTVRRPAIAESITLNVGEALDWASEADRTGNWTDLTLIKHVMGHEFAHGKDWREGKCEYYGSYKDPFLALLRRGARITGFYETLRDRVYHNVSNNRSGHPWDDPAEAYASAFHAGEYHAADVRKRMNELGVSREGQDIIKELIRLTGPTI